MLWGTHTSLYPELNSIEKENLEYALSLAFCGFYDEAENTFQAEPLSKSLHPLVKLELALMYDAMGLENECSKVLHGCRVPLERHVPQEGANIWDLIKLKCISSDILRLGKVPASNQNDVFLIMRRLASKNLSEYGDIEILKLARSQSSISMAEEPPAMFPLPSHLHVALEDCGRVELFHPYLPYEATLSGNKGLKRVEPYKKYISALSSQQSPGISPLKMAETRLFFAETLASIDMDNAREELNIASQLLAECGIPCPRLELKKKAVNLELTKGPTDVSLTLSNEICKGFIEMKHLAGYRKQLQKSYAIAKSTKENSENASSQQGRADEIRRIILEMITLEDQHTRSAFFLASSLISYGSEIAGPDVGANGATFLTIFAKFRDTFPEFSLPMSANTLYSFAAKAALNLGNLTQAAEYLERMEYWQKQCPGATGSKNSLPDVSDEEAMVLWDIDTDRNDSKGFLSCLQERCIALLCRWIGRDIEKGIIPEPHAQALLKLNGQDMPDAKTVQSIDTRQLVDRIFGNVEPASVAHWSDWFNNLERWVNLQAGHPSTMQRQLLLTQFQHTRVLTLTTFEPWTLLHRTKYLQETTRLLNIYTKVDKRISEGGSIEKARWLYGHSTLCLASLKDFTGENAVSDQDLINAVTWIKADATALEAEGKIKDAYNSRVLAARLNWQRYARFKSISPWACLSEWSQADNLYQALRADHYLLPAHRAFVAKESLAGAVNYNANVKDAMMASLASLIEFLAASIDNLQILVEDSTYTFICVELTSWIQRSKARALTDLLGQTTNIPRSVGRLFLEEPSAAALWEDCLATLRRRENASIKELVGVRDEFQRITRQLRSEHPRIQPFLDIHSGEAISPSELEKLGHTLGPSAVMVEWVHAPTFPNDIFLVVYREGIISRVRPLEGITMAEVDDWIENYLHVEEDPGMPSAVLNDGQAKENLNELKPLVKLLAELTEKGETLVLCPTQGLHRLPLHAISLGKPSQPLIQRNPVVYIQSLSLLRLCQESFQQPILDTESPFTATLFNTLGQSHKSEEELSMKESITQISQILHTHPIDQPVGAKNAFRSQALQSNILHIHGHADFKITGRDVRQSLLLREPPLSEEDILGFEDIFDLEFRKPSLMLAMCCNTGRAKVSESDDLLGLTAAFHVAGAGAVISTLWKIDRRDCLRFSKEFYRIVMDGLQKGEGEGGGESGCVNLALAFQHAVCTLRKEEESKRSTHPYHWAGFVLHGAWLFPRLRIV
ncbi:uncharacterized protein BDR25DRAFT_380039 [Lindgomyces ingoldianus]|uniref:Uncharacterized protein n=1 Tax=Lindgomyces ingoldianus TaxID=673940 RepID=A0ACB6QDF3_9PLEO|nr:uncharacterized protein BDR25DRAFT_380039 [Lindgomyces ingoldianus]KAF2464998.1 hypothetical protein BDR25DRAFT_380039 [Lindgomyces ingoldianus]